MSCEALRRRGHLEHDDKRASICEMEVLQHQIGELKIVASPPPLVTAGSVGLAAWVTEQLGPADWKRSPQMLCRTHAEQQILWTLSRARGSAS